MSSKRSNKAPVGSDAITDTKAKVGANVGTRADCVLGKQAAFLRSLAAGRSVRQAAEDAGVASDKPYQWREQDMDFAVRWVTAEEAGTDIIEEEAFRRAVNGVQKPVFRAGEVVGHVADYSDTMLMFLLKARRPDRYGAKPTGKTGMSDKDDALNLKGSRDALVSKFLAVTAAGETPTVSE